jgi:hypothetical protein
VDLGPLIRQLQGALGGRTIRAGVTTASFTASALSTDMSVDHGLPTTPIAVVVSSQDRQAKAGAFGYTSTQFTLRAKYDSVITGTIDVAWIAIG